MNRLTAVIITLNEEARLPACLDSLKAVVDEIVVVDSFSTDRTPEICRQYGVRFFQQKWPGYGQQKNYGVSLASHDYILSLDADEALSPELQQSILAVREQGLQGVYRMNLLNIYFGKPLRYGGYYPNPKIRVYDRREVQWSERKVHETLQIDPSIPVHHLKGDLLHRSKDSIEQHVAAMNKYSSLTAQVYFEQGKKGAIFKMLVSPFYLFVVNYLIRLGFLDGAVGYMMARVRAQEAFLKYSKLYLLQRTSKKS